MSTKEMVEQLTSVVNSLGYDNDTIAEAWVVSMVADVRDALASRLLEKDDGN